MPALINLFFSWQQVWMGIYLVVYGHIDINMAHHLGVLGASTTIGQSRKYSPDTRRSLETELGTGSGVAEKKTKKKQKTMTHARGKTRTG